MLQSAVIARAIAHQNIDSSGSDNDGDINDNVINDSSESDPELGNQSAGSSPEKKSSRSSRFKESLTPCISCCKHFFLFRNLFTPWLTVLDIVTDILAIIQYFKSDIIPVEFAWTLIAVLFCSFRFQVIWIAILYIDQGTADSGLIGKITICKAMMSYIPFLGCYLVNPNPIVIILDICASLFFFLGPIAVVGVALYKWSKWVGHLLCCGEYPHERFVAEARVAGGTYDRLTMIGVETFIADWESIMESLPQTVIGTYVAFTYLDEPSRFEDNMAIYVSLAISGAKLCYTVLKILISGGHQAGKEGWWRDDGDD